MKFKRNEKQKKNEMHLHIEQKNGCTNSMIKFCKVTNLISITFSQAQRTIKAKKRTFSKMKPKKLGNLSFHKSPFKNLEMWDLDF